MLRRVACSRNLLITRLTRSVHYIACVVGDVGLIFIPLPQDFNKASSSKQSQDGEKLDGSVQQNKLRVSEAVAVSSTANIPVAPPPNLANPDKPVCASFPVDVCALRLCAMTPDGRSQAPL